MTRVLTLPDSQHQILSIRAKALVFEDAASKALLLQAERVAASDANVLIIGETGTGKELIARHVHQSSGRTGPFVAVNCGAISENLVEAELFGHEAGAFTGATGSRIGWFEAANEGTLFLDEIGDLPAPVQVKLLRVLQERQVVRLGSRKSVNINVRLVAATNVRLEQAVAAGHFRADLYYRLNVAVLDLLPLAQRPGDILALVAHFIDVYSKRLGLANVVLGDAARQCLLEYSWPGNIRELENVIHYALIVNSDGLIAPSDLRLKGVYRTPTQSAVSFAAADTPVLAARPVSSVPAIVSEPAVATATPLERLAELLPELFASGDGALFDQVESLLICSAYAHCKRNQVHTAALLGVSRNVLRTQLKRFGLLSESKASSVSGDGCSIPNSGVEFTAVAA